MVEVVKGGQSERVSGCMFRFGCTAALVRREEIVRQLCMRRSPVVTKNTSPDWPTYKYLSTPPSVQPCSLFCCLTPSLSNCRRGSLSASTLVDAVKKDCDSLRTVITNIGRYGSVHLLQRRYPERRGRSEHDQNHHHKALQAEERLPRKAVCGCFDLHSRCDGLPADTRCDRHVRPLSGSN